MQKGDSVGESDGKSRQWKITKLITVLITTCLLVWATNISASFAEESINDTPENISQVRTALISKLSRGLKSCQSVTPKEIKGLQEMLDKELERIDPDYLMSQKEKTNFLQYELYRRGITMNETEKLTLTATGKK